MDCSPAWNCTENPANLGTNVISPILSSFLGIASNVIALIVLYWSSGREQVRTIFYVLVATLAWTDLLGIILTTWPVIVVYASGKWPGGKALCYYHGFAMIAISLITPCLVFTMAIERFLGIRHGYFYKRHVTRRRIRILVLLQWFSSLLFASLPFMGFGQYVIQHSKTWCYLNMYSHITHEIIYAAMFASINLLLITLTLFCNCFVIVSLLRMRRKRIHINSPTLERRKLRKKREVEVQMVILLVGITLVFIICWSPLMFQILINQITNHKENYRSDLIIVRLATINQIVHPWVYILLRKTLFTRCWSFIKRRLCLFPGLETLIHQRIRMTPTPQTSAPPETNPIFSIGQSPKIAENDESKTSSWCCKQNGHQTLAISSS